MRDEKGALALATDGEHAVLNPHEEPMVLSHAHTVFELYGLDDFGKTLSSLGLGALQGDEIERAKAASTAYRHLRS